MESIEEINLKSAKGFFFSSKFFIEFSVVGDK